MFKMGGLVAIAIAASAATAVAGNGAFSRVVAELNATASAGAQGSDAGVTFTSLTRTQQGLPAGGSAMSNAGKLLDLSNVIDGAPLAPTAAVKPGSWALRGNTPPGTDDAAGINPSGPDAVTVIPLPSALGLAGVGLLGLTIRRRAMK